MRSRTSYLASFVPLKTLRECTIRRFGSAFAIATMLLVTPACRRAAFNEFYVESMASEIRALEDRIYEYDSAYQSLEMENEDLRAKHERLQRKLRELEEQDGLDLNSKPRKSPPRDSKPSQDAIDSETFELVPPPKVKTEEPAPIVPRSPTSPPTDTKPEPSNPSIELLPKADQGGILPPPAGNNSSSVPTRTRKTDEPKTNELVEEYTMPPAIIRSAQQPNGPALLQPPLLNPNQNNAAPLPSSTLPTLPSSTLPTLPPTTLPTLPGTSPGAIIQGRIKVPSKSDVVQASATEVVISIDAEAIDSKPIEDRRVVGIEFHPTLCRGINLDNQPGDDGLYLVITPKNQFGQTLNQECKLTIVAEETIDDKPVRISAWDIDPTEMKEYLEPIGASQGYHLRLPWQENAPTGRTIQVFVKCEFEDGRKPVNRKEITLSKSTNRPLTWTPRQ